jgi:hypothetical protein
MALRMLYEYNSSAGRYRLKNVQGDQDVNDKAGERFFLKKTIVYGQIIPRFSRGTSYKIP